MLSDISKLSQSLKIALNQEFEQVQQVQSNLLTLTKSQIPICDKNSTAIATVATDGGENKLILDPIRLQIIRVVDSKGEIYFEDFVALSFDAETIFKFFFKRNKLLQWFISKLKLEWDDVIPNTDFQKANLMGMLRELLEWAAILRLMNTECSHQLVVRDGLLRSVGTPRKVFEALQRELQRASTKYGHSLVGVAKRSRVLNYLSLVISLEDSLPWGETCYIGIPKEMEIQAAPPNYRWASPRSMGELYLARLASNTSTIYPVEIPSWENRNAEKIMSNLAVDTQGSFPDPGYPLSLIKAHRYAHIGGFEITMLEKMLIEQVRKRNPALAEHVIRQMMLGRKLSLPIGSEEEE
jgi:hypothetical protein